jgi:hypothetical protein
MPATKDPSTILTGAGRTHIDVVSAAADLFDSGSSAMLNNLASVISQPLAIPNSKTYTAGGSGDATKVISSLDGPFYVGDSVSDVIQDLFKVVLAADDTEIFNPNTQQYVTITSIAPVAIGSGFYASNLTVTFSTPVPANVIYKIYYGKRSTVANLPVEMSSNPVIRRSPDRVRFPEFNRTGYAPTSITPEQDYTISYPDPYLAQWKARAQGTLESGVRYEENYSGSTGFVHIGSRKHVDDARDHSLKGVPGAAFLAAYEKDLWTNTFTNGSHAITCIGSQNVAVLTSTDQITLNISDYFYRTGPNRSAIRLGVDMLEITFPDGSKGVYVIRQFGASPKIASLLTLGGAFPNFTNPANVTVKWIRPTF